MYTGICKCGIPVYIYVPYTSVPFLLLTTRYVACTPSSRRGFTSARRPLACMHATLHVTDPYMPQTQRSWPHAAGASQPGQRGTQRPHGRVRCGLACDSVCVGLGACPARPGFVFAVFVACCARRPRGWGRCGLASVIQCVRACFIAFFAACFCV